MMNFPCLVYSVKEKRHPFHFTQALSLVIITMWCFKLIKLIIIKN